MRVVFFFFVLLLFWNCKKPKVVLHDPIKSAALLVKCDSLMQGSADWAATLDSAILLDTMNAKAYMERSVWFTKTGDYVQAFRYLDKAVEKSPVEFLGYRGWLKLYKLHDYTGAISDLQKLDSLTPGVTDYPWSENIQYLIGIGHMGLGEYEKAISSFNDCIAGIKADRGEKWVDVYVFLDKGVCQRQLNQLDSALVSFDKVIQYCDKCPEAYFQKAMTLKSAGNNQAACASLLKAQEYAEAGYIRKDPYKDYLNQLYIEEVAEALAECDH